jgi:hypothetical protein
MPIPTRIVEIEFDAGVWTDVSADVVNIRTRRGRNRESGAFETGQMTVTLRNDTRKYDPDHTSGPYYGKLRPNRRIRWTNTYSASNLGAFQGYIDRISQQYGGPNDAAAEIQASDLFKLLARTELPRSVYVATVAADAPDYWWPLDEPSGSASVVDIGSSKVAAPTFGNPGLGANGLVVRDPGSAMAVTGGATAAQGFKVERVTNPTVPISGTGAFTIEFWLQCNPQARDQYIFQQLDSINPGTWIFVRDSSGANPGLLDFRIQIAFFVVSTIRVDDGAIHHVVCRRDGAGEMRIFIDGVDRTTTPQTNAVDIPTQTFYVGGSGESSAGLVGTLQHFALYKSSLISARIDAHNAAGRTPWNGEASGARLLHVYDLAAVSVSDTVTDAGSTTLQATSLGGTALGYVQKVEETEAGRLFVNRSGKVQFLSRYNGDIGGYLTSKITLVDADSGAGTGYRDVSADVDESTIVTRATVSREGSVAVTYNDTAAQAEFKIIDETHEGLLHNSDTYSKYYAEWIVNTHKTPASRLGALTLELVQSPDLGSTYITLLALEIADRVTYKRKPQNVGAVITQDLRVEAIEHETGGGYWRMRLQLTPFNLGASGYGTGVWDTSLWDQATWGL